MKNKCTARNGNGSTKIADNDNLNPVGQTRWIETKLFFGLGNEFVGLREEIPSDAPGTDWETFLHTEVVPTLGGKFTVLRGEGFWQEVENGETVRESVRVLFVVHPDTVEIDQKLETLQYKWCVRYNQKSVLRVNAPVDVRF
jgi:hypothetical protein